MSQTKPSNNQSNDRVVVTGCGICSAIGNDTHQVVNNLRAGNASARKISRFSVEPFQTKVGAEVELDPDLLPPARIRERWDRGTLMAIVAGDQALKQANLDRQTGDATKFGVATGVSGSGQFQTPQVDRQRNLVINQRTAQTILEHNVPNFQAEEMAKHFHLNGPQTTVSSASAGSGIAISIATRWLQSNRCDAVLAGGSECLSVLNIIGFDVLGITAKDRCHPFSASDGMMMGEGAGYLLLERESSAKRRGAKILCYVDGVAVSADAFDPVLFDPTGDGQRRAMRRTLREGGVETSGVHWIRASGSGGRDQDTAEVIAIKELFGETIPPVTSLEPFFGHCNGAGPAIGMIAAISCMNESLLPPTLNFESGASPPAGIDFVPNVARKTVLDRTLCNSAAFGGTNVAILCSRKGSTTQRRLVDDVVITGVGTLSALGYGGRESIPLVQGTDSGIDHHDRFEMPEGVAPLSGLVRDLKPRKLLPQINLRGVDLLARYAAVVSQLAWNDAKRQPAHCDADRLGVVSGLAYASGKTTERLMDEVYRDFQRPTVGKVMLRNGRFMVTSQLAHWFSIKGYNSTLASGELSGLHALATAKDQLANDDSLDAVLVVAADEVSSMYARLHGELGNLVPANGQMLPYSCRSDGRIMGEGAVAMVLERASVAAERDAPILGRIAGQAMHFQPKKERASLDSTIRDSLADAAMDPVDMGSLFGLGTGNWQQDRIEIQSIQRCFGSQASLSSTSQQTGLMDSSTGLLSAALGLSALQNDQGESLVVGRGRTGHQIAMVFSR